MIRLKWAVKSFAAACAAVALMAFGSGGALAQSKTLKIIVPYTPGSGPDIISRLMGEQIAKAGGPTVVVENRPGGGMTIGTEAAARAEPDGGTVLLVANAFTVNMAVKRGNFTLANFEPVCNLATTPMPLVVQSSSPWKTVQELVDYAKANPGKFTFASGGPATSLHVAIEVLRLATKIDTNYVPYGGSGPAINALIGGHVQAVWADFPTVVSHLKNGTLRALATSSPKRIPELPGVPTLTETGITKYEAEIFYGIVAPAKTPQAALGSLGTMLTNAMNTPEMKEKFAQQGLFPDGRCGDKFGAFLRDITADYERVTTAAGIKPN
ncbi:MAG: tripartite tricarboxylate transporter substrate binding protein [Xanthobacteraceae bacterium]|nr:tripartite tricarboxylate transporter substrate binding protein [Xanthobacteraceae bacterium]